MNHRRTEFGSLKDKLKNIFFIGHDRAQAPLTKETQAPEQEDHRLEDYILYYQQATRWK